MTSLTMPKKVAVGLLAVLAVTAVAVGGYYTWLITPPGMPDSPEDALATIASARYERLPEYRKQDYLDRTAELMRSMPEEQRRDLFRRMRTDETVRQALREVRQDQQIKRLREWAQADPNERRRLIDEMIEQQEQMRQRFEEMRRQRQADREAAGESAGPRGERDGDGPRGDDDRPRRDPRQRIQRRIEEGNPQTMAWRMEMREAVSERRRELGLPDSSFGGRGGGRR